LPLRVKKGNLSAVVKDEKELSEARKEGWK